MNKRINSTFINACEQEINKTLIELAHAIKLFHSALAPQKTYLNENINDGTQMPVQILQDHLTPEYTADDLQRAPRTRVNRITGDLIPGVPRRNRSRRACSRGMGETRVYELDEKSCLTHESGFSASQMLIGLVINSDLSCRVKIQGSCVCCQKSQSLGGGY